ncbi:hypothetical protein [Prosthecomicrobium hirschii]|uniref:hypothetical protein n=1 Tax=Prosthecodimorpha hirschii TaxID=665126 RepID=UPI002220C12C|nr:hypothetical protein [Prosthecomicrobium hirschii]MCW1839436.1 hypothetical protein [Prosthecomicrobium hirschii]
MPQLSAAWRAALDDARFQPAVLVDLDHPDGRIRAWNGAGPLTVGGVEYLGLGRVAAIDGIANSSEIAIQQVRITLVGIPADVAAGGEVSLKGRLATIAIVPLDGSRRPLADPIVVAIVDLDQQTVSVADDGTIGIAISGQMGPWVMEVARAVYYTPEELKRSFGDDSGADQIHLMQDRYVEWPIFT